MAVRPRRHSLTQIDQVSSILEDALCSQRLIVVSPDASRSFRLTPAASATGRVIEVGVSEASAVAMAYGLSLCESQVAVIGFSSFLVLRALEPIRSLISYHRANVLILGGMSGLSNGRDGYMHQSTDDVGILSAITGIDVFSPSDESSLRTTMAGVLGRDRGPAYVRLYRTEIDLGAHTVAVAERGAAFQRINHGRDFVLLSYGHVLQECARAVHRLARCGLRGRLIEVVQLEPFDADVVGRLIADVDVVIVAEDHLIESGLGRKVQHLLYPKKTAPRVLTLGLAKGQYGSSARVPDLLALYGLDAESIADSIARCHGIDLSPVIRRANQTER